MILDTNRSYEKGTATFGAGTGLSYGGIGGGRLGLNVLDGFNVFGALGYQLGGFGYNLGVMKHFEAKSRTQLYLTMMYGTNANFFAEDIELRKLFTGFTYGVGIKVNSRKVPGNYWDLGILYPSKSEAFSDYQKHTVALHELNDYSKPFPISFNVGYNFDLGWK